MKRLSSCLATVAAIALAPMGAVTMPALSSAAPPDCAGGQFYEPVSNACQTVGPPPPPAFGCGYREYYSTFYNGCRPFDP
jgi:hypothetical protein